MEYSLQHEYCEKKMIKKSAISLSGMTYFRSRSSRCPLTKRKAELLQKYTVLRFLRKGVHMSQESCLPVWTRIMCCMIYGKSAVCNQKKTRNATCMLWILHFVTGIQDIKSTPHILHKYRPQNLPVVSLCTLLFYSVYEKNE